MAEALAALDELAKSMQDELTKAVENVPKIELDVSEDDEGYIVVCSSTTDAFDDRVEILLEEGVLGLVLPATQGIQMVLPIVRCLRCHGRDHGRGACWHHVDDQGGQRSRRVGG